MTEDHARTFTRYRRRFDNSGFGSTPAHNNLAQLNRTWQAGVLEQQTVTYTAWTEVTQEEAEGT